MILTSVPNLEIKRNIKKQQEREPESLSCSCRAMSRAPPGAEREHPALRLDPSLLLSSENCVLLPFLFAEYIMQNARLDESQAIIKIARRNIQQPQIFRLYHSNGRKRRATKEPLDESERGELKSGFKLNSWIQPSSCAGQGEGLSQFSTT